MHEIVTLSWLYVNRVCIYCVYNSIEVDSFVIDRDTRSQQRVWMPLCAQVVSEKVLLFKNILLRICCFDNWYTIMIFTTR